MNTIYQVIDSGVLDALDGDESLLQAELLRADVRVPENAARCILERVSAAGTYCDDRTVCLMRVMERSGFRD